jgi:hypothetical protein
MPRGFRDFLPREALSRAEAGLFLQRAGGIPHLRIPVTSHRHRDAPDFNPIYDLHDDPGQITPLRDDALETRLGALMREKLIQASAPLCQYERVGLDPP